jgi:hypothetical protein
MSGFFHNKVFCAAFMCLQFGFEIFWQKDFCSKAAHKMLVILTPGVLSYLLEQSINVLKFRVQLQPPLALGENVIIW